MLKYFKVNDYGEDEDDSTYLQSNPATETHFTRGKSTNKRLMIGIGVGAVLFVVVGVLIGYFSHGDCKSESEGMAMASSAEATKIDVIQYILQNVNKDNLKNLLRNYTSKPRLSGSNMSLDLAEQMAAEWRANGIDHVTTPSYDVLLSYPNKTNPNKLEIIYKNGTSTGIESAAFEKPLDPEGNNTDVVPPYNSFAKKGVAEGELVYVNYGRVEDLQYLVKNMSMNLTGKIAIARYGKIFRGDKVKIAQQFNMTGIVMFTDPSDFNIDDTSVYPDSWWMPPTGVQRGTVGTDGDVLTPLYPATGYAFRERKEDVLKIKIPAQPISYGDAWHFLSRMKGEDVPPSWQGKLNFTYKFGPGFTDTDLNVRLTVNNYEEIAPAKNVIGYIKGQEEPDRTILMGNHHDAWVFGAIDPLSGSAVITELTRVFGDLLKQGIRPRRTIVFCSWGAEEQGLVGSTEWVEEHMKVLYERAVAYLNVDYAVDYTYNLAVGTSPLLQDSIYAAAKQVPNPTPSSQHPTLYDIWKVRSGANEPSVYYSLGSGSDMATFYQRAGVPSTDFWYTYNEDLWDILSYPLYHSAYETFRMYSNFIDPSFNYTRGIAHLLGILAWNIANEEVLNYDVRRYPTAIDNFIQSLEKDFGAIWQTNDVNIAALKSANANFTASAATFHRQLSHVDKNNAMACRIVNDKMMQLERAFIDPEGLPGRREYKHVMFAPSQFDSYSDNSFPGIVDTMFEINNNNADLWNQLKKQVFVATYIIQSAANTLDDIGL